MSLFAAYTREVDGFEIISHEYAFLDYRIEKVGLMAGSVYIRKLYVHPDFRNTGVASELADEILNLAKENDLEFIYGTVDSMSEDADYRIKVLHGYKMKFFGVDKNNYALIFRRKVSE